MRQRNGNLFLLMPNLKSPGSSRIRVSVAESQISLSSNKAMDTRTSGRLSAVQLQHKTYQDLVLNDNIIFA